MDNDGEWQCNIVCLEEFKSWLHGFEGQKAASIFAKGSQYRHSHPMPVDKICNAAKSRLEKLNLEPEAMFQLEIGRVPRLWGFLEHNIFHVVWVDREHTVYPMK